MDISISNFLNLLTNTFYRNPAWLAADFLRKGSWKSVTRHINPQFTGTCALKIETTVGGSLYVRVYVKHVFKVIDHKEACDVRTL